MSRPSVPRPPRRSLLVAAVALLLLPGCTVSGQQAGGPPTGAQDPATDTATAGGSSTPSPSADDGVPVSELSAQLLDSVPRPGDVEVLASQTVLVDSAAFLEPFPVTIDVLQVQRLDDATLVTMQMSAPAPLGQTLGSDALTGSSNSEFFDAFGLDDTTSGIRYRALTWRRGDAASGESAQQPTNSCICPYRHSNLALGPTPIVSDSLYGPLPEGLTTVTLSGPNGVSIPDLPVADAVG